MAALPLIRLDRWAQVALISVFYPPLLLHTVRRMSAGDDKTISGWLNRDGGANGGWMFVHRFCIAADGAIRSRAPAVAHRDCSSSTWCLQHVRWLRLNTCVKSVYTDVLLIENIIVFNLLIQRSDFFFSESFQNQNQNQNFELIIIISITLKPELLIIGSLLFA